MEAVLPKIAIIGCGVNNKFNHPREETLEKLKKVNVYRTDLCGEITIKVDKSSKICVETMLE